MFQNVFIHQLLNIFTSLPHFHNHELCRIQFIWDSARPPCSTQRAASYRGKPWNLYRFGITWFSNIQSFPLLEETQSLIINGSHVSAAPVRLQYFLCWSKKLQGRQNNHISMRLVKKYETYIINISVVSRLSTLVVSSSCFFTSRLIKPLPVPPKCRALIQGSQKCLHSHAASHSRPCYLDSTRSGEWWWMKFSYGIVR